LKTRSIRSVLLAGTVALLLAVLGAGIIRNVRGLGYVIEHQP